MSDLPIGGHALLSDRRSAAIVTNDGCVAWFCAPRFDSPSVFATLLDDDAGHWWIRSAEPMSVEREYVAETMVLRSTYGTEGGTFEIVEALDVGPSRDPHALGEAAPHSLIRIARCVSGAVELEMEFRPRPGYGTVVPHVERVVGGARARGGDAVMTLSTRVGLDDGDGLVRARFRLEAGQSEAMAVRFTTTAEPEPRVLEEDEIEAALEATAEGWRAWSRLHQHYRGPWMELVHHSGRVLQALSYQPTGAIIAAATTSLPEVVGGERNWDYRYAWVRDASFTLRALWVAACPDEANQFFEYVTMAGGAALPSSHLQIVFGVEGERELTERDLPHWSGWRGSAPVRIGNGAWDQAQLDVYGELLDAARLLERTLAPFDPELRRFLVDLAETAADRWQRPDHGIWEIRGEPRHYLFSKLMCWVALERAIAMAESLEATDRVDGWRRTAEEIRAAILTDGWNERLGAFTQSFGSDDLDASALMLPLVGFLPADDARVRSTVDAVRAGLVDDHGLVRRYDSGRSVDRLDGHEGSFLLCTFWLARVLAEGDRLDEAREVFERAIAFVNDVGLLAEEVDPSTGELLGNFPQAFSHVGLVNAAWSIAQAEERAYGAATHGPGVAESPG
ncbi:glycoside hydrolase family 15 protein [Agromyces sp. SYSU T0242]|uniref:glycoside hydrolase family 15 protein n=1 Tax=Agromyces litoreus TaxID=3158561 RepID=UPI003398A19A